MFTLHTTISAAACRSCGAYGNSQHAFSCCPGRSIKLGHMRHNARDRRTSAAVRTNQRIQASLIRGL